MLNWLFLYWLQQLMCDFTETRDILSLRIRIKSNTVISGHYLKLVFSANIVSPVLLFFCSLAVLDPRVGHTMAILLILHFSLCSVILIDSSTGCPVHVLMVFIQVVRGLSRLRCSLHYRIISFSRQLPCFLMFWPQSFLALTVSNSSPFTPALTHSFV